MCWGVEPQICKWTQIVLIFFSCFPHRDGSFRKSHIGRIISALQIQSLHFKVGAHSWMLIKLVLIFTKINEINVWEVTRYSLSMACFLDRVQLQISFQNQTSPMLQQLSGTKTKIVPSKRQKEMAEKRLISCLAAVLASSPVRKQHCSINGLALNQTCELASSCEGVTDKEVGSSALAIKKYTSTPKTAAPVF